MRNQKSQILFTVLLFGLLISCEKWNEHEKFKRPDWLPGKLYTTLSVQEDLTMFAECLRLTGLDDVLDVSGIWDVFAPTDEAMKQYLSENQYSSVSDIPFEKLERLTKFHIIQNSYSLEQLQHLGAYGWRTENVANVNSYGYKRETMFKNSTDKYWIKKENGKEVIVIDSTKSDGYRKVFVESRKYVPIFYDEYFDKNDLTSDDFRYYFNREYEKGNVYYAGAKIIQSNIFAENGFVYIIDKVVEPMLNARELLERDLPGENYKLFLQLVYRYYPDFEPNMTATFSQAGVRQGELVDTLWDLTYSPLAFNLHGELTGTAGPDYNLTLVRHNGLVVPDDNALKEFFDNILTVKSGFPHYRDFKSLPRDVADIIVTPHFRSSSIYPSSNQYEDIFREDGRFQQNEDDIIRKEFGSNCTFIGLDGYVPDRVFTSVTGPVFCRPAYSTFRLAMEYSGVDDVIANRDGEVYFFPIPDSALEVDSSLMLNWINRDLNQYNFRAYDRNMLRMVTLGRNAIRNMILNHAGTPVSVGSDNKEIIRTLRGNTITWDHSNNTIRGSRPSTIGYNGAVVTTCTPVQLEEPCDNGKAWSVNAWFSF